MSGALAFDVGRSACRATRVSAPSGSGAGALLGTRVVVEAGRSIAEPGGLDAVLAVLVTAEEQLEPQGEPVATICVGVAGLGEDPLLHAALADRLALAHPGARVIVASDMVTAHAGALAGGSGVVLAAGTGAVALGVMAPAGDAVRQADGRAERSVRVDGWGWLVGDDGGGFAIGRAGLAAALRAHDGRGPATRLRDLAEERFGEIGGLARLLHRQDRPAAVVASFATRVLAAADGDATACAIRDDAARALATTAAAAVNGLFALGAPQPVPVACTGGLTRDAALFGATFHTTLSTLAPAAKPVEAAGEPLDGAARLAVGDDELHAHLLHSYSGTAPTDPPLRPISTAQPIPSEGEQR